MTMRIVRLNADHLPAYVAALRQGYSSDNVRGAVAAQEIPPHRRRCNTVHRQPEDREAKGPLVTLPTAVRSTAFRASTGGCGTMIRSAVLRRASSARWQPGTTALPRHVNWATSAAGGSPWKRQRGYATQALTQMLEIRELGLPHIDITTDPTICRRNA